MKRKLEQHAIVFDGKSDGAKYYINGKKQKSVTLELWLKKINKLSKKKKRKRSK